MNLKYADKVRILIRKLLSETRIFSVTGSSIREALNAKDLEVHYINLFVFITDKNFHCIPLLSKVFKT